MGSEMCIRDRSHTIIVSAAACPSDIAAAVPPPGVGDEEARAD